MFALKQISSLLLSSHFPPPAHTISRISFLPLSSFSLLLGLLLSSLIPRPLRVQNSLEFRRCLEAGVVGVFLVEVVVGLGLQLVGQVFKHALEHVVDRFLLGRLAVPDGDEMAVETDREAYAADLVTCIFYSMSVFGILSDVNERNVI